MKKFNLLIILILLVLSSGYAQPKKSLDEIDNESFHAGASPFASGCIPVNLVEKSIPQVNAPEDIVLDGEWQMVEGGEPNSRLNGEWPSPIGAMVPGSVHTALWKSGKIPDPYFGRNDTIANRQSFKTWWFKKEFKGDKILKKPRLIFGGVAVKCNVWLNGVYLGEHEGMFGGPEYDVSKIIRENNTLIVKINPAPRVIDPNNGFFKGMNIGWRSSVVFNCVYGWHYSNIPSLGIWRSVRIQNQASVEVEKPFIVTKSINGLMNLQLVLKRITDTIKGKLVVSVIPDNFKGTTQSFEYDVSSDNETDTLNFSFTVKNPQLWWPNDLGKQNLYRLKASFIPRQGNAPDYTQTTFGIRTVTMDPFPGGPYADKFNWTFNINGTPHFIKGNGWCTMDPLMNFSHERYDRFLSLAKFQHIQMMRAWGGGMPENDDFYDLCDRYGIMVIQEWPTAWDSHLVQPFDMLKETVELNTVRIRNHPSLAMWGGGNESGNPFGEAIDMMGRTSIEKDGSRPFHRGEPWGGSKHNYDCWWGKAKLDHNLNMESGFWGEFGIAAMPVKESVLRYLPEPEKSLWPPDSASAFAHHTPVFNTMEDLKRLTQYSGYVLPGDNLDHFILGSQLAQVVAVRHTLERSRTRWPECTGALYYKMNDNYPAVSWSCVDWYGAPKPLHFFAQDAFSPVASVVLFEHTDMFGQDVSLPVFLLDDNLDLKSSPWKVKIRAFNQKLIKIGEVEFSGNGNQKMVNKLGNITLTSDQTQTTPLLIVSEVFSGNKLVFKTFYYMNFETQKGNLFNLPRTSLSGVIKNNKVTIKNAGSLPAVGVNLQSPGQADKFTASDNYFWLDPGESVEVEVNMTKNLVSDAWNLAGNKLVNIP